jgi:hypothetical protein
LRWRYKRADENAKEHARFGEAALAVSAIIKWGLEDHALTDEFGICRTREVHTLAGGELEHVKISACRRAF